MSDSNRVALSVIREETEGTTPATPEMQNLRITQAPTLAVTPETIESEELDPERQVTDLIKVGQTSGGEYNGELSYNAINTITESIMANSWSYSQSYAGAEITAVSAGSLTATDAGADRTLSNVLVYNTGFNTPGNNGLFEATITVATNVATATIAGLTADATLTGNEKTVVVGIHDGVAITGSVLTLTTAGLVEQINMDAGTFLKLGGGTAGDRFANAANNDWVRVASWDIGAKTITVTDTPVGWIDEDKSGAKVYIFFPEADIRNGTERVSMTYIERFLDHNPVTYQIFRGQRGGTMSLDMASKAIINMTFGIQGTTGEIVEAAPAGTTYKDAPTDTVMNTSSNIAELREGGTKIVGKNYVTALSLAVNANLRNDDAIGYETAVNIGLGTFSVTGTATTYFDDKTMVEKVINNTETSLFLSMKDNDSQVMLWDLPRVKYSSGSPSVPGRNTATTAELGWTAIRDKILGYTMRLSKYGYIV